MTATATATAPGRPRAGLWPLVRVEVAKLSAQLRIRVALGAAVVGPLLFAVALAVQGAVPGDTLFGRWVHESGFAVSFVVLAFSGQWALPILVAVVAGDTCAEEDRHRTWSLLLTRSRTRGQLLAAKVVATAACCTLATAALAASATLTGVATAGARPVAGLSGALLSPTQAWAAVWASWASVVPPVLALAALCVLVSTASRSTWVGVGAPVLGVLVLNLVSLLSVVDPIRAFLPTSGMEAWHGLARTTPYTDQVTTSVLVSVGWIVVALAASAVLLARRDVVDA